MLPSEAKDIVSLQTFNLINCHNLTYLPSLEKMTCLRHLNIFGYERLIMMPACIKRLRQLQTLPLYIPSSEGRHLSDLN